MCVVKARNNFESTRAEVERLMKRIRSAEEDFKAPGCFTMEGFLYIQEKRELSCPESDVAFCLSRARRNTHILFCRTTGQRVDQILLYLSKKHQDVHDEQHRGQTGQPPGAPLAATSSKTIHVSLK